MFVDKFTLKKTSWHMRLMTFIWGYHHYDFRNMCPYFWLSVFNVVVGIPFIVPVKLVYYGIRNLFDALGDMLADWVDKYQQRCFEQEKKYREEFVRKLLEDAKRPTSPDKPSNDDWFELWYRDAMLFDHDPGYRKLSTKKSKGLNYAIETVPTELYVRKITTLHEKYNHLRKVTREREWEEKEKKNVSVSNSQRIGELTVKFKAIFTAIGIALLCILAVSALFGLGMFLKWSLTWPWAKIAHFILMTLAIIALSIVLIASLFGLYKLASIIWCAYGEYCIPCEKDREKVTKVVACIIAAPACLFVNFYPSILHDEDVKPGFIIMGFVYLARGIKFAWSIIVAVKNDNCPALEWEE